MNRLTILFAGLGSIGQRHLRNLWAILPEHPRVLAYRTRRNDRILTDDLKVESTEGLEKRYQMEVFEELEEALELKPDIVFVTNPNGLHFNVALPAVRAGCHIFVDKPLSDRWDGVEELMAETKKQKRVGYVGYQLRFHPAFEKISAWLRDGRLGRIVAIRAEVGEYMPGFHRYEDYRDTYHVSAKLGGGVVLCQIHEYDLIYALLGMPSEVFAVGGKASRLEMDAEDMAQSLFRYQHPGFSDIPVQIHQDFLQRMPRRSLQIIGDDAVAYWDYIGKTLTLTDPNGGVAETKNYADYPRNNMFLAQTRHFLACVAGREQPRVSLHDGAQSLRMALAVKQSMATGKIIQL